MDTTELEQETNELKTVQSLNNLKLSNQGPHSNPSLVSSASYNPPSSKPTIHQKQNAEDHSSNNGDGYGIRSRRTKTTDKPELIRTVSASSTISASHPPLARKASENAMLMRELNNPRRSLLRTDSSLASSPSTSEG
jgi:hypothetical protein